jgi:hypothetical protein
MLTVATKLGCEKARQRRGITTRHDGVTGAWFWRIDLQ